MTEDTDRPAGLTVRRLLELVRTAPGGGIHRTDLELEFRRGWAQIWPTAKGLYGRGLVDFCGPYLVAVPRQPARGVVCIRGRGQPTQADRDAVDEFAEELRIRAAAKEAGERHPVLVPQLADTRRRSATRTRA